MISDLGSPVMWKQNKQNRKNIKIVALVIVAILFIVVRLNADEKKPSDDAFIDYVEEAKTPESKTNKNIKIGKTPKKFVPSKEVSADQAVAFPIDI